MRSDDRGDGRCDLVASVDERADAYRFGLTYPRYFFTNESGHIRGFFIEACNQIGVAWRFSKPNTISVARRESVAKLDGFVGSKS